MSTEEQQRILKLYYMPTPYQTDFDTEQIYMGIHDDMYRMTKKIESEKNR